MPLRRIEDREEPRGALGVVSVRGRDADQTADHQHPGALVDLVLLQLLALRQVDHDGAPLRLGVEHLWLMRLYFQFVQVPSVHGHAGLYIPASRAGNRVIGPWSSPRTAPPGPASRLWQKASRGPSGSPTSTPVRCTGPRHWPHSTAESTRRTASGSARWPGGSISHSRATRSAWMASPWREGSARRRSPSPPPRSRSTHRSDRRW